MRPKAQPAGQKRASFIESARRRQIVETAIETIATQGFLQASLSEIARQAGISKGVISYHFSGKEELIEEILRSLLRKPAEFVKERVGRCETALEKIEAYIDANFEFMAEHRDAYVALVDLWGRRGEPGEDRPFHREVYEPSRHYLGHILEEGQRRGEFRSVPIEATASLVQAAIDGVMLQWVFDEEAVDLSLWRRELIEMATRYLAPLPAKEKSDE